MAIDNACPEIIERTKIEHIEYARLYFRPRTPTQYNNEGMRPKAQRSFNSHCPTPVFFCFDAFEVLTMDDVRVSDGNMGTSHVRHSSTQDFFESIPFEHVFHFGPYDKRDNRLAEAIKFHRHAEVLVPEALPLGPSLRHILVRSPAEASTLLGLLPAEVRKQWEPITKVGGPNYFNRDATFIETVSVVDNDRIKFEFNPSTKFPGPFDVDFSYNEVRRIWSLKSTKEKLIKPLVIGVKGATKGTAQLLLDDCIAFRGELDFADLPF